MFLNIDPLTVLLSMDAVFYGVDFTISGLYSKDWIGTSVRDQSYSKAISTCIWQI